MNIIIRKNLFKIGLFDLKNIFLLFLLLLPVDFYAFFPLYSNETPYYIDYKWLEYNFGIISLIIIIIGIYNINNKYYKFILAAIYFSIREIIFYYLNSNNCINENAYEIYCVLILSASFFVLINKFNKSIIEKEKILLQAFFLNIFLVYISYFLNLNKIVGRYNASNMDVEATGVISGISFIICMFDSRIKYRYILAMVAFGGLILSGSRFNLLITLIILIYGFWEKYYKNKRIKKRTIKVIILIISSLPLLVLLSFVGNNEILNNIINKTSYITRMLDTLNFNVMESDDSVLGRSKSIEIGIEIIKNNIFGISGYFTNLQLETQKYGFPTFPHSTFLSYYILLGPIVIIIITSLVNIIIKIKEDTYLFLSSIYLFLFLSLSGGPILSYKPLLFYFMILHIANEKINYRKNTVLKNNKSMVCCKKNIQK